MAAKAKTQAKDSRLSPVYLLRPVKKPQKTLNQIGGLAPGVTAEDWPSDDDDGMEHLFTLDLATMPETQAKFGGKRTLSVFVSDRRSNEAYSAYNGETRVLLRNEADTKKDAAAPEETPVTPKKRPSRRRRALRWCVSRCHWTYGTMRRARFAALFTALAHGYSANRSGCRKRGRRGLCDAIR